MGKRSFIMLVALLLCLGSLAPPGGSDGGSRGPGLLGDQPAWTDTLDDMSHVYVPSAGLVGVQVSGGEVGLSPGNSTGWVASSAIACPAGLRYDYCLLEVDTPGGSSVQVSILDPSREPSQIGYANETVAGLVDREGRAHSLYGVDPQAFPEIRVQVRLVASGPDRPRLLAWSVLFCDADLWQDPFIGLDRDSTHGNLQLGGGEVRPVDPIVSGGLKGSYYDNKDLTGFKYSNPHEVVDFDWGYGGPTGLDSNTFSISWEGYVRVNRAESYTFYVRSDDGSRLWIDGQLRIDKWVDQSPTEHSTTLNLEPGYHEVRLDYFENSLTALCEFRYSSPTIAKTIVPAEALYAGGISDLVSETITLPQGYKWELLMIERVEGTEGTVAVDVIDPVANRSIYGCANILGDHLDLTEVDLDRYASIQLKARWDVTNVTRAPGLSHWMVKWVKRGMWREQFYVEARPERLVGLAVEGGALVSRDMGARGPTLVFAGLTDDAGGRVQARAYLDPGGLDYISGEPMALGAWGTSALDVADVNGDGHPDVALSVYRTSVADYGATSPLLMGSPVGWRDEPLASFPTTGATDVLLRDLNGDGHVDVVFAQEQDGASSVNSTLFWGSPSGWNNSADVSFATSWASGVDAADVDGDGDLDLAFSCYMDASTATDSMVFLQEAAGFCGTLPSHLLATRGATAVAAGDIDGDGRADLVFANGFHAGSVEIASYVYWGEAGGGFGDTPTGLPTKGTRDVVVADVDGDTHLDVVFACGGDNNLDPAVDSYVYLNDGAGGLPSSPNAYLPTVGAAGVAVADLDGTGWKDLVFACLKDRTSHRIDSVVYLGGASGWSTGPDIALPTTGASDVLPVQLAPAGTGGYMSKRITPEDPSDTGTFHTFGYTATLGAGVSARVHVLDATSWEVLAERDLSTGTHEWSMAGAFDLRDHPSVRVLVTVEGLDGPGVFAMDDLFLNWTKRVRREPRIIGLQLSASSVYRLDRVTLWVDAEDEYDPPQDLRLTVEHALNGTDQWGTHLLGPLAFKDGRWTCELVPRVDTSLGLYDLRARARDTDTNTSAFFLASGVLEVLNNPPTAPEVRIEPARPTATSVLRAEVTVSAVDVEGSGLSYRYSWSRDGAHVPDLTGDSVSPSHLAKGQNWSVEVRAFDGDDEGPPAFAWVLIVNAPPIPRTELPDPVMDEDTIDTEWLDLSTAFEDPDGDALTWSLKAEPENITVTMDPVTGQVTLAPDLDWFGDETLVFVASDGELTASQEVVVHVLSVNDLPVIATVDGNPVTTGTIEYTIRQGKELLITYTVTDVEGDDVFASVTSRAVDHDEEAGTIRFAPGNDEVGTLTFTLRINDVSEPDKRVTQDFVIVVENENDPMGEPRITNPTNGTRFKVNQSFSLMAICDDPDVQFGQELNFTWSSNISGVLGHGASITARIAQPGTHLITLRVSDPDFNRTATVTVVIEATAPPIPPPPPDDDEEPASIPWGLIAAVVAAVVIAAVVLFVVAGRRRAEAFEARMDAEEEAEEKREALERTRDAIRDLADRWEDEAEGKVAATAEAADWVAEDEGYEEIEVPAGQLSMEAKVTEAPSEDVAKLWVGVSDAEVEKSEEDREALRLEDLKRKYQNAIGRLPYGIPSKELQGMDWVALANALATGEKKQVEGDREVTRIDGRWYYSDHEDSSTFLKEHGAKPREVPRRAPGAEPSVDRETLMAKLEERFILGEISEDTYRKLREKYGDK